MLNIHFNFSLAPSPDNSLKYYYWDIQYAPPYNDASDQFQLGFRGDQQHHFRWLAHKVDRLEVGIVSIP